MNYKVISLTSKLYKEKLLGFGNTIATLQLKLQRLKNTSIEMRAVILPEFENMKILKYEAHNQIFLNKLKKSIKKTPPGEKRIFLELQYSEEINIVKKTHIHFQETIFDLDNIINKINILIRYPIQNWKALWGQIYRFLIKIGRDPEDLYWIAKIAKHTFPLYEKEDIEELKELLPDQNLS